MSLTINYNRISREGNLCTYSGLPEIQSTKVKETTLACPFFQLITDTHSPEPKPLPLNNEEPITLLG